MKATVVSILLFVSTIAAAQTVQKSAPTDQDLTAEQKEMVVKLANLQKNFGRKMNSPGVELSLKEVDRTPTKDRTLVKYELYARGLPTDLTYTLFKVQISGKILKQLDGVKLNPNGRAIAASKSPIELLFFAGKSEPIRLSLVSGDDSNLKGFVSVIPFPNSVTDKSCKLQSVLGTPKGEVTYVEGSGFEPNEELTMEGESYGEKNQGASKAEADGSYFAVAMPNVLGKTSGTTIWSVRGKNCNPKLTFTWGTYHLE